MKILSNQNYSQNQIQNAVAHALASAPGTPVDGQFYWNTTSHQLFLWNANTSAWEMQATNSALLLGQNGAFYLARANHTGTQLAATISDLAVTVKAYTLDSFAGPVGTVNFLGQTLTGIANAVNPTDALNLQSAQTLFAGLSDRAEVAYTTAAALPANTYANGTGGVGATLTATSNAALSVDSVAVVVGQRILVKNEVAGSHNGIYTVTAIGSGAAPYVLTRATDANTAATLGPGIMVPCEAPSGLTAGTANNGVVFLSVAPSPFVVGTSSITFTSVGSTYSAGNGLSLTGTTFAVALTSGSGLSGPGLTVSGAGLSIDTTVVARKYSQVIGDGSTTSIVVTHNLGTQDIVAQIKNASSPFDIQSADIAATSTNTATFSFSVAPATNALRVTIIA